MHVDTGGVPEDFTVSAAQVHSALAGAVYRTGAWVRTSVRAHASGRPGPRARTGDYRRSIAQTNGFQGKVPVAWVFTNAPQGRRLEYGFNSIDALGRHYRQPPYPHWRPAIEGAEAMLDAQAGAIVDTVVASRVAGALHLLRRVIL